MKKSTLLILATTILLFLGCNKKAEVTPVNFVKCKIDGKTYSIIGKGAYAEVTSATLNKVFGTEAADSKITSPQTLQINIESDKGVGTHDFVGKTQASFEKTDKSYFHTNFNNTLPKKGTLTITEKTATTLKGTFSFSAFTLELPVKKIEVTEGEFSVTFK